MANMVCSAKYPKTFVHGFRAETHWRAVPIHGLMRRVAGPLAYLRAFCEHMLHRHSPESLGDELSVSELQLYLLR